MSCIIKKLLANGEDTDLYKVSPDNTYNGIFNGLAWNVQFSMVSLFAAFLFWSKFKTPFLGPRRGEDVDPEGRHILKQTSIRLKRSWGIFVERTKKWFFLDKTFLEARCGEEGKASVRIYHCDFNFIS
jgi:hypothetical protein